MNNFTVKSGENQPGEFKVTPKFENKKKIYTKTDGIFAIIFIVLSWFFVVKLFFGVYNVTKLALLVYILGYSGAVFSYAKIKGKKINSESFFWLAFLIVIALLFKNDTNWQYSYIYNTGLLYSNRYYGSLPIVSLRILVARYFTITAGNGLIKGGTSGYIIYDLFNCISMVWMNFLSIFGALATLFKKEKRQDKKTIAKPVLAGGIIGVLALAVVIPLLIGADENLTALFGGIADKVRNFILFLIGSQFNDIFIIKNAVYTVAIVLTACYQFAGVYTVFSDEQNGIIKAETAEKMRNDFRISPAQTINIAMYIVSGVYVAFMLLQFGYLFSAFAGKLWGNMTYSSYARQGFFQLCAVSGVNIVLLLRSNLFGKKGEEDNTKKSYLLICVLSILLLTTACAKMIMYISVYGLTCKRIVSCVFLVWLFVIFTMFIAEKMYNVNSVKYIIFIGVILFCWLYICDINKISDNYNTKYGYDTENMGKYALYIPQNSGQGVGWRMEKVTLSHYDENANTTDVVEITSQKDVKTVIDILKSKRSDELIYDSIPYEYDYLIKLKMIDNMDIDYPSYRVDDAYYIFSLYGKYYIAQSYHAIAEITPTEYSYFYNFFNGNK